VGEVGLDFSPHVLRPSSSHCTTPHGASAADSEAGEALSLFSEDDLKEVQRGVFQQQIQLANELGLPVNVHSRSAGHHAVSLGSS
jgi:TatD DNase family protein